MKNDKGKKNNSFKRNLPTILVVLVFIVGISVFLYPTVSNYLNEKNSTRAITNHIEKISKLSVDTIAEEKEKVRRYNKSLFENCVVLTEPFDEDAHPITDGEYDELLAFDPVMAYVEIPAIKVNLPIYHSTSEEVLLKGVGHLRNSSLPIGGESTHAVLAAHTGLPSARLFTDLVSLKKGNLFYIHVLDEVLIYRVYKIEVVLPNETKSLFIQKGRDLVTLTTCTPYGKNTHRLLVHGERIEKKEAQQVREPKVERKMTWEDYSKLAVICITAVFILILLSSIIAGIVRKKKKKKQQQAQKEQNQDN